jgi:hypothetical protein
MLLVMVVTQIAMIFRVDARFYYGIRMVSEGLDEPLKKKKRLWI